jgi:hypothetical protein
MPRLLAQSALFLPQEFSAMLHKLSRTEAGQPLPQMLQKQPPVSRTLPGAAQEVGLQIIEPLQPFIEPPPRMEPQKSLRQ